MKLPEVLAVTDNYLLTLPSGSDISIPLSQPNFEPWQGPKPEDTYGEKSVLNHNGYPVLPEILILKKLQEVGWNGVWVDTFRNRFLKEYFLEKVEVELPEHRLQLFKKIENKIERSSGCLDVYCWKDDQILFAEAKRKNNDQIRDNQKVWIQGALEVGISKDSLLIVEWTNNDV